MPQELPSFSRTVTRLKAFSSGSNFWNVRVPEKPLLKLTIPSNYGEPFSGDSVQPGVSTRVVRLWCFGDQPWRTSRSVALGAPKSSSKNHNMLCGFPIPAVYRVAPEYVRSLSEREKQSRTAYWKTKSQMKIPVQPVEKGYYSMKISLKHSSRTTSNNWIWNYCHTKSVTITHSQYFHAWTAWFQTK